MEADDSNNSRLAEKGYRSLSEERATASDDAARSRRISHTNNSIPADDAASAPSNKRKKKKKKKEQKAQRHRDIAMWVAICVAAMSVMVTAAAFREPILDTFSDAATVAEDFFDGLKSENIARRAQRSSTADAPAQLQPPAPNPLLSKLDELQNRLAELEKAYRQRQRQSQQKDREIAALKQEIERLTLELDGRFEMVDLKVPRVTVPSTWTLDVTTLWIEKWATACGVSVESVRKEGRVFTFPETSTCPANTFVELVRGRRQR